MTTAQIFGFERLSAANRTRQIVAEARTIGEEWAAQEVECWRDQHDGIMLHAPEWTYGTYAGNVSHVPKHLREAYETAIDDAARGVWDANREWDAARD